MLLIQEQSHWGIQKLIMITTKFYSAPDLDDFFSELRQIRKGMDVLYMPSHSLLSPTNQWCSNKTHIAVHQ